MSEITTPQLRPHSNDGLRKVGEFLMQIPDCRTDPDVIAAECSQLPAGACGRCERNPTNGGGV